jgi:putative FmdB family regulatory protein
MILPIFEYECSKCKKLFELLVSRDGSQTTECPFCSSREVTKLFSSFRVGSGKSGESRSASTSSACSTCASENCDSCG